MQIHSSIILENSGYRFSQSSTSKPLETLTRIELIFQENLKYSGSDEFASYSADKQRDKLLIFAFEVQREHAKQRKTLSFFQKFVQTDQPGQITETYSRITHNASLNDFFVDDLIQEVFAHLDFKTLLSVACANSRWNRVAEAAQLEFMKQIGFRGNNAHGARARFRTLTKGIKSLVSDGLIPRHVTVYHGFLPGLRTLDAEATLLKMRELKIKDQSSLNSALYRSCATGQLEKTCTLLYLDADPNAELCGFLPLTEAAAFGHLDILKVLIAHGADASKVSTRSSSVISNVFAVSALDENRLLPAIEFLLNLGDFRRELYLNKHYIFNFVHKGQFQFIELLLETTPKADVARMLIEFLTIHAHACKHEHVIQAARALLEHGADVNAIWNGNAVSIALNGKYPGLLELVLQYKPIVNNNYVYDALFDLQYRNTPDKVIPIMDRLIEAGLNLPATNLSYYQLYKSANY